MEQIRRCEHSMLAGTGPVLDAPPARGNTVVIPNDVTDRVDPGGSAQASVRADAVADVETGRGQPIGSRSGTETHDNQVGLKASAIGEHHLFHFAGAAQLSHR
jgi:hypothetical protein